ncbi:MAG: hypothetical protein AAB724_03245 [Patescibacteria group bacterium]
MIESCDQQERVLFDFILKKGDAEMLSFYLIVDVEGQQEIVTLDEIFSFLREDEKREFKNRIGICREDQWFIRASADSLGRIDMTDKNIRQVTERLFENAFWFYLIAKERIDSHLCRLGSH